MKTHSKCNLIQLLLGLGLMGMHAVNSHAQYSFQGIGDLPGGDTNSYANAISADGSTVVGSSGSAGGSREAFIWTSESGIVGIGDLPGGSFYSEATAVNADGTVVVGTGDGVNGVDYAFRWTSEGGMVSLGDIPGGPTKSWGEGVNADGSVVVGLGNFEVVGDVTGEAFRWTSGTGMVGLGDLPGGSSYSWAYAVSADSSVVVGGGHSASGWEAFRWTASGGMVGLGVLPGDDTSGASAVNSDGSVVFGFSAPAGSAGEVFRWTAEGGMVGLGFTMGLNAVSADGSVMVGNLGSVALIWDEVNGLRNLADLLATNGVGLAGWTLDSANGISADGTTIVGNGVNPDGFDEGWIATIPATTYPLLIISAAGPGQVEISWTPDTGTNWVLQESSGPVSTNWINAPSGNTNPVLVPATGEPRFYRLNKP